MIDSNANILGKWSFDVPYKNLKGQLKPDGHYYATFPTMGNPGMIFSEDYKYLYLHMHRWMNTPGTSYTKEEYQIPYIVRYNMSTESIEWVIGKYPPAYISDEYSSYEFASPFLLINDVVTAFFERSHLIFTYDQKGNKSIRCVKSKSLPDEFTLLPHRSPIDQREDHYKMMGSYLNLIHDPFRQNILRVATFDQPDKDQNGVALDKIRAKWSLMILDYSGSCIKELEFPREKYDFRTILCTAEGIYVSTENPYNFKDAEEIITFHILDL